MRVGSVRHDAENAPEMDRALQSAIQCLVAQVSGQGNPMLQHPVVKIHHIQRAVWPGEKVHGAKALIGRSQEFRFVVGVARGDAAIGFRHHAAADEVARGLRDEDVALKFLRKPAAVENKGRAGGGVFLEPPVAQLFRAITAIDAGVHSARPHELVLDRVHIVALRMEEVGIAGQIFGRDGVVAQLVAVGIIEQTPARILAQTVLAAKRRQPVLPLAVLKTESRHVRGAVDPVVEIPQQRVRFALGVRQFRPFRVHHHPEVRGDFDFLVRLAGAFGVPAKP